MNNSKNQILEEEKSYLYMKDGKQFITPSLALAFKRADKEEIEVITRLVQPFYTF